ncbi:MULTISPECIES: Rha family transcriptional regulator [Butyricimonas]|uniref:Rha family transcriptional regulator n=1 Tax=Butyricimonas TaxID=574697 RepID=UPI0007FB4318|nr:MULTISPECIES: Rha family transcriptional regulator [Butyricimonas]
MKQLELFPVSANGLVTVSNDQVVTTSLKIAEVFEKRHCEVLRAIRNNECSDVFQERNFAFSFYHRQLLNGGYKKEPMYYLTRDGFTFLAMGFTGKVAAKFKEAYINAFNEMEERLRGATIKEEDIATYLRSLCEDMDSRMKGHEKQLQKQYGSTPNPGMLSPALFCTGSLKSQLDYIFKALNNDILAGQFAWAKLEKVERENKEMKRELAKVASKLLNYYY